MFTIEILQYPEPGYSDPIFSWKCPLCSTVTVELQTIGRNWDKNFVIRGAKKHLVNDHNAWLACLTVRVRNG